MAAVSLFHTKTVYFIAINNKTTKAESKIEVILFLALSTTESMFS
jgi:hypothetical protein